MKVIRVFLSTVVVAAVVGLLFIALADTLAGKGVLYKEFFGFINKVLPGKFSLYLAATEPLGFMKIIESLKSGAESLLYGGQFAAIITLAFVFVVLFGIGIIALIGLGFLRIFGVSANKTALEPLKFEERNKLAARFLFFTPTVTLLSIGMFQIFYPCIIIIVVCFIVIVLREISRVHFLLSFFKTSMWLLLSLIGIPFIILFYFFKLLAYIFSGGDSDVGSVISITIEIS